MLKKSITYCDYDGNTRTEDFYFNLSKADLIEMDMTTSGGMKNMIDRIVNTQDTTKVIAVFKDIIRRSYGEKSLDGKRFVKNQELTDAFMQTEAYSELFMELISDGAKAAEFVTGIIPSDLANKVLQSPEYLKMVND